MLHKHLDISSDSIVLAVVCSLTKCWHWCSHRLSLSHSGRWCSAAGHFRILSKDNALPLVAFSLTKTTNKEGQEEARQYTEFDLADKLRQRGWVLPAYTMAPDAR